VSHTRREGQLREANRQRVVAEQRTAELYGRTVFLLKGKYGKRANVLHELSLRRAESVQRDGKLSAQVRFAAEGIGEARELARPPELTDADGVADYERGMQAVTPAPETAALRERLARLGGRLPSAVAELRTRLAALDARIRTDPQCSPPPPAP
jgi:hypothetical protein